MHIWQDFLHTQRLAQTKPNAVCSLTLNNNALIALKYFAILTVNRADTVNFLQGQITANIHDISNAQSRFTALCDAKAKIIATFLFIKSDNNDLMLLFKVLINIVKTRLQSYILREKINIIKILRHIVFAVIHA